MTSADVQRICRQIGLHPQTAAGQNFLLSESVVDGIVEAAEVTADDKVLEIGPGLGILTEKLFATGAQVTAVEIDRRLNSYLQQRYRGRKNLEIVHQDIFKVNLTKYFDDGGYKLVANLPYSGTGLILKNFLTIAPRPISLTIMLQADVAERILAEPGQMSLLALMVQYYGTPMFVESVGAENYWPKPKVKSSIIRIEVKDWPDLAISQRLWKVARAGFSTRRKQLHNSLVPILHLEAAEVVNTLAEIGVKKTARPQELTLENWLKLATNIG